jgi:hypothetical protein
MNAPENKRVYCLQPLAVVPLSGKYSVLDGQQRLTTLFLLYKYLTNQNAYTLEFVRDNEDDDSTVNRWSFLTNISSKESIELADSQIDLYYIHRAYQTIYDCFETNRDEIFSADKGLTTDEIKSKYLELLNGQSAKSIQVIWYEVPENKAHETFRNLNSGKISLTNTELIKALFLNRASGLNEGLRDDAARQFEEMEQIINNDHFGRCYQARNRFSPILEWIYYLTSLPRWMTLKLIKTSAAHLGGLQMRQMTILKQSGRR